jgi:hypothetical protein
MRLSAKTKWAIFGVVISLTSAWGGYWLGATRERQTQYKLLAFHLTSSLSPLLALQQNNIAAAKHSLEVSASAGVLLLPPDESIQTSTTRTAVKDGLEKAKCYGMKHEWKSISPELRERLNNVLKGVECGSCNNL